MREPGFETICAHAGEDPSKYLGAVTPPIFQNSLFVYDDCETFSHRATRHLESYDYTRVGNPTTDILEAKIAALEKAESARASICLAVYSFHSKELTLFSRNFYFSTEFSGFLITE